MRKFLKILEKLIVKLYIYFFQNFLSEQGHTVILKGNIGNFSTAILWKNELQIKNFLTFL